MKRIFSLAILFHWMMFFALHAAGAAAGRLDPGGFVAFSLFEGMGPMRALPLVSAGLGFVCLLAAVLFAWTLATVYMQVNCGEPQETELERAAFASSALVFSVLSLIALVRADPDMLMSATAYFAALLVSWAVASVEWELLSARAARHKETEAARHARMLAGEAAWHMNLTRISGRKGVH